MNYLNTHFLVDSINEEGHFKGVAAVFNNIAQAKELDVIVPGAFTRTIDHWGKSQKRVPFLYQHQWDQVLGSFPLLGESERGLEVEGDFDLDTQLGKEKHSLAKKGHLTGLSIGFKDIPGKTEHKKGTDGSIIRFMREVKLFEISLVTFPADEGAVIEYVHQSDYDTDCMAMKMKILANEGYDPEDEKTKAMAIAYCKEEHARFKEYYTNFFKPQADSEHQATTQQSSANPALEIQKNLTANELIEVAETLRYMWSSDVKTRRVKNRGC